MIDHCTWFPERWPRWKLVEEWDWKRFWELWEIIYIGGCCAIHDETEEYQPFYDCLDEQRVVCTWLITAGGTIGIWWLNIRRILGVAE